MNKTALKIMFLLIFVFTAGLAAQENKNSGAAAANKQKLPNFFSLLSYGFKDKFIYIKKANKKIEFPENQYINVIPEKAVLKELYEWKDAKKEVSFSLLDEEDKELVILLDFSYGGTYLEKGKYLSKIRAGILKSAAGEKDFVTVIITPRKTGIGGTKENPVAYAEIIINVLSWREENHIMFNNTRVFTLYGDGTVEEDKTHTYTEDGKKFIIKRN